MRRRGRANLIVLAAAALIGALIGVSSIGSIGIASGPEFTCQNVRVIDGDTFDCDGRRIRLHGIDAPELAGHCRRGRKCVPGDPDASTASLSRMTSFSTVTCRKTDMDHYGRTIARCTTGSRDISCAQIERGHAVRRYGSIIC